MSAEIIKCKKIASDIRKETDELRDIYGINNFKIVVFLLSSDEASGFYAENIRKDGEKRGFHVDIIHSDPENFSNAFAQANEDDDISGIMVQFPIPKKYPVKDILKTIKPEKDIDGIGFLSVASLYYKERCLNPSTAEAVIEILKRGCNVDIGEGITVVGRSNIVGLPLFHLLLHENFTPTICHSKTHNLKSITSKSKVLISAIGKPNFFDDTYILQNSILIDVGTNFYKGKWVGDFDFEKCTDKAAYITKVPSGVGSVTRSILYRNMIKSIIWQMENRHG